jgi:hypothetical protein
MIHRLPVALFFLSPAVAGVGLALAAIPIIIHILNLRQHRTIKWAAMELLLRAMQTNRRRKRFEQMLLLAMRCGVLALLGLALARPIGCDSLSAAAMGGRAGMTVFVIDNSYSMAYLPRRPGGKTHLDQARQLAEQMIDQLSAGSDQVAIITAGTPAASVIAEPTYDLQQARAIIDRIPQAYGGTDLSGALRLAIALGRAHQQDPGKRLALFTDGTASAWQSKDAAALKAQGPEAASLYNICLFNMSIGPQWNQAVLDLHPAANLISSNVRFATDFVADVKGFGPPHDAILQWEVDGKIVPGGGKITLDANTPPQIESKGNLQNALGSGGTHTITARLISDDPLQIDNSRTEVVNVASQLKTLIVEGERGTALAAGPGRNVQVALAGVNPSGYPDGFAMPELISDLELGNRIFSDDKAIILCGVREVAAADADRLQAFVKSGGTLMIFLSPAVVPENYNSILLPRHLLPGPLVRPILSKGDAGFHLDFNPDGQLHPLLKAFAHQQNTGLETAEAFGYWKVDMPDDAQQRVLNWKSDLTTRPADSTSPPDPAITEQMLGKGRVLLMSTSADEEWITFTRKPIYTELLNELLSGSVNMDDGWMNRTVGDCLEVPASLRLTTTPTLLDAKSVAIPLVAVAAPGGEMSYRSAPLTQPAIYQLSTGVAQIPIAVNPPADEADVHTIDDAAVRAAMGGIDFKSYGDRAPDPAAAETTVEAAGDTTADASANGSRVDWGWTLLLGVLGLVAAESYVAMSSSRVASRP